MSVISPVQRAPVISRAAALPSNMTVADAVSAYRANPKVSNLTIKDTAANIQSNFDVLNQMGNKLAKLAIDGPGNALTLTASQYTGGAHTLAVMNSNYELKVTNVSMDKLNAVGANAKVKHLEVMDTSSNISARFQSLLNMPNKIDKVTQTDAGNAIALSGDQYKHGTSTNMLSKVQGPYVLALGSVAVADLATANADGHVTSVSVNDTSANISANLRGLTPSLYNSKVSSIAQTDASNSITVTDAQFQAQSATLGKLTGASSLAVTGVTAAHAAGVAGNANVRSVSVTDTAANVFNKSGDNASVSKITATNIEDTAANLTARFNDIKDLSGITKVKVTDAANISITGAQLKNNMAFMGKIYGSNDVKGAYKLAVTGVAAADVAATSRLSTVEKINVTDSVLNALAKMSDLLNNTKVDKINLTGNATDIGNGNIDKLDGLGAKLASVTNTGAGTISMNYSQYVQRSATLAKIDAGSFNVSGVGASAAKLLSDDARVSNISVKDSAANISTSYADLKTTLAAGKLGTVQLSDTAGIKLTANQYTAAGTNDLLAKVTDAAGGTNYKLQLSGALASNIVALSLTTNFGKVTKVAIQDSSSNISANLGALGADYSAGKLGSIKLLAGAGNIGITKDQLDNSGIAGALSMISGANDVLGNYKLAVSGVGAADASSLVADNNKVAKLSVSDTSAHITSNLTSLNAIDGTKLEALTVTDPANEIAVAASDLSSYTTLLSKVTDGAYQLNVSDVSASKAKLLSDTNSKVSHMTVSDSGTSVSAKLTDLNTLTDSGKLTSIQLTDASNPLVLTSTQYSDNTASALAILNGDSYKLSISGVSVADAVDNGKSVNSDGHVASYSVKDTGSNIVDNLQALDARGGTLQSINWTDTGTAMEITGAQYVDFNSTLSKINGGESDAHITDLGAKDTLAAESDTNISQFSVKDTADKLGSNLAALETSAANGTPKIQAIAQEGGGDVAMTAANYGASTHAITLMGASGITGTVSDVAAGDAATVTGDSFVSSITVSDTASNIAANLGDASTAGNLDGAAAKISALTVSDQGVLDLTAAQYSANTAAGGILDKLSQNPDGYHATVSDVAAADAATAAGDYNVDSFTVSDTGANLGSNFGDLVNAGDYLTKITNSDSGSVAIGLADLASNASGFISTLQKFDAPPAITLS